MFDDRPDELREPGNESVSADDREARLRRRRYARPDVDIYSTPAEMVVLADMPGVQKSDVDVTIEHDDLVVEGRVAGRAERESALPWGYHRRFRLKTAFDRGGIQASLQSGVLRVVLPKASSERPQRVAVG